MVSTLSRGLISLEKISKLIAFALLSYLPVTYAGDNGDDFSNNLFSDLAPLLTLFGEEVTKQFLSQPMGWADNIIIAMAPLGILTIMVSAIRVGGHQWLKNIIGRAREGDGTAEAELMSSTSSDVCELWGRSGIARVLGSPDLVELVYRVDHQGNFLMDNNGGVYDLRGAVENEVLYLKSRKTPKTLSKLKEPPNLVLNVCGAGIGEWELWLYAILGVILQLAVLVWCILAVKHMKYRKGGVEVEEYALPLTIIGTILVCTGASICSRVVEASTIEHIYVQKPEVGFLQRAVPIARGMTLRLFRFSMFLWTKRAKAVSDQHKLSETIQIVFLQRGGQMVNDQRFEAYAIFGDSERQELKTSRKHNKDFRQLVLIGMIVTLCGFILQFIGLRAMHWSCTIAQLLATVTMTALRAVARRGLSSLVQAVPMRENTELQWLAKNLSSCDEWAVVTGFHDSHKPREDNRIPKPAESVLILLQRLSTLTNWHRPSRTLAISTARAMERIMNTLYNNKENVTISESSLDIPNLLWLLPVNFNGTVTAISFELKRTKNTATGNWGQWAADMDKLEAILSLWMLNQHEAEIDLEIATRASRKYVNLMAAAASTDLPETAMPLDDLEKYLPLARKEGSFGKEVFGSKRSARQEAFYVLMNRLLRLGEVVETDLSDNGFIQILGRWSMGQEEDYRTWLPIRTYGSSGAAAWKAAIFIDDTSPHVVGFLNDHMPQTLQFSLRHAYFGVGAVEKMVEEAEGLGDAFSGSFIPPRGDRSRGNLVQQIPIRQYLLSETNASTNDILGLDLVSKLMWSVVEHIETIGGVTLYRSATEPGSNRDMLINLVLGDLAKSIVDAGLGDIHDAYNVTIPPLSEAGKLPKALDGIRLRV